MTPAQEDRCAAALLRLAARSYEEQAAHRFDHEHRGESEADREALRLAADHGVSEDRLRAYDSLARSRGLALDAVLRSALSGELRDVVLLPASPRPASGPDAA